MSTLLTTTALTPPGAPSVKKVSPAEEAFNTEMAKVSVTAADEAEAKRISASGAGIRFERVTPGTAKCLYVNHNVRGNNRPFSFARSKAYQGAMGRGEWKRVHQGVAFYPDGSIADGQHRLAACALSGITIELSVMSDFDRNCINAIDRSKARNAGELLEMAGVQDGRVKATIAKSAIEYSLEVDTGERPVLSDEQIETFVMSHASLCDLAMDIGRKSHDNVVNAVMSVRQAANVALLMIMGGYAEQRTREFMACVQTGQAGFPESPTTVLSARLFRAVKSKNSEYRKDAHGRNFLALALEAAALWEAKRSASRLNVNLNKAVPSYHKPVVTEEVPVAAE